MEIWESDPKYAGQEIEQRYINQLILLNINGIKVKTDLTNACESDVIEAQKNYREFLENAKFIFDIYPYITPIFFTK